MNKKKKSSKNDNHGKPGILEKSVVTIVVSFVIWAITNYLQPIVIINDIKASDPEPFRHEFVLKNVGSGPARNVKINRAMHLTAVGRRERNLGSRRITSVKCIGPKIN